MSSTDSPDAPPRASYLIAFRDDDGARLPLLQAALAWLRGLPHLEVIVVEQDREPRLLVDVFPALDAEIVLVWIPSQSSSVQTVRSNRSFR